MLLADQVGYLLSRLQDPRVVQRFGAGAPALLHQTPPDLGSGASVPDDRAYARSTPVRATSIGWRRAMRVMSSKSARQGSRQVVAADREGQSDSACFDNALELLVAGGYSLPHAMMLLIPEAWQAIR